MNPIRLTHRLALVALIAVFVTRLPAQTTPARPSQPDATDSVYTLSEFVVNTPPEDRSFKTDETLGAMRITTAILDTPINVSVIPRQFMEDFLLVQDLDIMAHVAGAGLIGEPQYGTANTRIRGFSVPYYRNGFSRIGTGEVVNMERVEIIKGPLAATFGRANPGGLVNYITNALQLNYGPTNRIEEVRPSSTLLDAFVSYDFATGRYKHSLGLNVRNLADREWWGLTGRLNDGRAYMARYGLKF